jgi:hypothetical protein
VQVAETIERRKKKLFIGRPPVTAQNLVTWHKPQLIIKFKKVFVDSEKKVLYNSTCTEYFCQHLIPEHGSKNSGRFQWHETISAILQFSVISRGIYCIEHKFREKDLFFILIVGKRNGGEK